MRQQTATKVRKLYDSGLTMRSEIAGPLNISAEGVSRLLAQSEK